MRLVPALRPPPVISIRVGGRSIDDGWSHEEIETMRKYGLPMGVMDAVGEMWGRAADDETASVAVLASETGLSALLVLRDRAGQSAVMVRRHTPCDEVAG